MYLGQKIRIVAEGFWQFRLALAEASISGNTAAQSQALIILFLCYSYLVVVSQCMVQMLRVHWQYFLHQYSYSELSNLLLALRFLIPSTPQTQKKKKNILKFVKGNIMFVLRRCCNTIATPSFKFGSIRKLATHARVKEEGDVSSVFVSLSGASPTALPEHSADIKRQLVRGNESLISASWRRLLKQLSIENELVAEKVPAIIPQINFDDLNKPLEDVINQI